MKEQDIQRKIIKFLESQGAYVIKTISTNRSGVPDIIACYKGKFIAIEVKTPKTKNNVSELQKSHIKKIQEANGIAIVAWSVEQVEVAINYISRINNITEFIKELKGNKGI